MDIRLARGEHGQRPPVRHLIVAAEPFILV